MALLKTVYGPEIPEYVGSAYAETRYDHAELVLHELSHAVQIQGLEIVPGKMSPGWDIADRYIKRLSKGLADRHEIRAIATTIRVAKSLRLPFERHRLIYAGTLNSMAFKWNDIRFDRAVALAERTPAVRRGTQQILDLLDRAWRETLGPV